MANNDWQEYQFIQGAVFNNETVTSFGNIENELVCTQNQNIICDLSHLGLLEISGDDAVTFLQGQVTNDVRLLDDTHAHYTGYCSPKGRLLALFFAFSHNQKLHLEFNQKLLEPIAKRLKMFVMRSKVTINDVSDANVRIGLSGNNIPELLAPFFVTMPKLAYESMSTENGTIICLPNAGMPRYQIICNTEQAKSLWQALKKDCKPVGKSCWEWLEIQAGIPDVYLSTQEEFVPQMLNLDALNAINYKKGCYTGQEIVARTHYLGKVKRRTQLAHIASDVSPAVGDDVMDANQQAIGKIVRSAQAVETGFVVLAECRLENLAQSDIYWKNIALSIKQLPYSLETVD
ncbi:folate-binding protein [Methylotenera sp.]|uniref:CAF17-like 4Fe-4S cluster assembly/insertion protein YgfZ n=1 Tax=Methylotenera sp. TaxID=2051956 RepID=UPI002488E4D0|nr:folate-binding protein [Methylotenera sp.]MDI1299524.1 folate-binding protein [Methylotenera sp.]